MHGDLVKVMKNRQGEACHASRIKCKGSIMMWQDKRKIRKEDVTSIQEVATDGHKDIR